MKYIKKIISSFLFAIALVASFQISASAAGIASSTEPDTKTTSYQEYGTFYINSGTLEVRNDLNYNSTAVATYGAGESFNYDYVVEVKDNNHDFTTRYVSYVSNSGVRRYIPFMERRDSGDTPFANYTVY